MNKYAYEDTRDVSYLKNIVRAVPGKTASGGWNGNQLKFGGWGVFPGI